MCSASTKIYIQRKTIDVIDLCSSEVSIQKFYIQIRVVVKLSNLAAVLVNRLIATLNIKSTYCCGGQEVTPQH